MDGFQATNCIREKEAQREQGDPRPPLPIVALTASATTVLLRPGPLDRLRGF
jgi:CheY-like chemotaxis protein